MKALSEKELIDRNYVTGPETAALMEKFGVSAEDMASTVECKKLETFELYLADNTVDMPRKYQNLIIYFFMNQYEKNAPEKEPGKIATVITSEPLDVRKCRECGCTDEDCSECIEKTGAPCWWVEEDLCSACKADQENNSMICQGCGFTDDDFNNPSHAGSRWWVEENLCNACKADQVDQEFGLTQKTEKKEPEEPEVEQESNEQAKREVEPDMFDWVSVESIVLIPLLHLPEALREAAGISKRIGARVTVKHDGFLYDITAKPE